MCGGTGLVKMGMVVSGELGPQQKSAAGFNADFYHHVTTVHKFSDLRVLLRRYDFM